jgi:hypothetical protein
MNPVCKKLETVLSKHEVVWRILVDYFNWLIFIRRVKILDTGMNKIVNVMLSGKVLRHFILLLH